MTRITILASALALSACGASVQPPDFGGDALTVVATIGPQSLTHGALTAAAPELAYAFNGVAGDIIAPDVWPTGASALLPALVLLGPKGASGHRSAIATDGRRLIVTGPSGSDYRASPSADWQTIAGEGFHALSIATKGKFVWACGSDGRIAFLRR